MRWGDLTAVEAMDSLQLFVDEMMPSFGVWDHSLSTRRGVLDESRFDPNNGSLCAPVAQLDRVPGYEPGGRGFDSLLARHLAYAPAKY